MKPTLTIAEAMNQLHQAQMGLRYLIDARTCSTYANNKRTRARITAAISSARGAVRICEYRLARAQCHAADAATFTIKTTYGATVNEGHERQSAIVRNVAP